MTVKRAGIVIKPCTDAVSLLPYLSMVDLILIMTVEPSLGGQNFMQERMATICAVRQMIIERKLTCELEVDGGIKLENATLAVAAGADVFVSGTGVFRTQNVSQRICELKDTAPPPSIDSRKNTILLNLDSISHKYNW